MSEKYALIIANTKYADPGLEQLSAPGKDADDLARVLRDKNICAFDDVKVLLNEPEHIVREKLDEFFDQRKPDDLLVLYFSGHGVRDEMGALYLAVQNTNRFRLRSTAIKADFIREAMDQSRSKRQVLVLDCCNSGAFAQGTKAATGVSMGTASAFEAGYGRIILTASDSTQFAWEGDRVIGETDNSLFTHFLVKGLEGEADLDGDGRITVDELYDYAYESVKLVTPKQTPSKFSTRQQGEIVLRHGMRLEDIRSVALPAPLLDSIDNPFSDIRLGAVQQLIKLLHGKNLGLARSARETLERIANNDDSRQVSRAAMEALESARQGGEHTIPLEADGTPRTPGPVEVPLRSETGEPASLPGRQIFTAAEQAPEVTNDLGDKKFQKEGVSLSSRQALLILGWALAGIVGGSVYNSVNEELAAVLGGAVGGVVGGLFTVFAFHNGPPSSESRRYLIAPAWAVGLAVGWHLGDKIITETAGMGIGFMVGAMISLAILLASGLLSADWKRLAWIVIAWAIGGGLGWFIAKRLMIERLDMDWATSWVTGMGVGWTIAGFVMSWQLLDQEGR